MEIKSEIAHLSEKLKWAEKQLSDIQKIAHIGNWEWDIQANKVSWSDELYEVFGLVKEQLTPTFEAFLNVVHPEDRQRVNNLIHQAIEAKQPYSVKHRKISPDGTVKYLQAKAEFVFDTKGNPVKLVGIAQDITEQVNMHKELEEKQANLLAMIENTDDLIWLLSKEAKVLAFNSNFFNLFKKVYNHELQTGEHYLDLLAQKPERFKIWANIHKEIIRGEKRHFELEFEFDSQYHCYEVFCNPIIDNHGEIRGASYKSSDITKRKKDEKLLQAYHENEMEMELQKENIKSLAVIQGQEDERRRIAMELHDGVGQILTALFFQNSYLKSKLQQQPQLFQIAEGIDKLLEDGKLEIRRISNNLMPKVLDTYGLSEALAQLIQLLFDGLKVKTQMKLLPDALRFEKNKEVGLYRIAQEVVNNCIKYAKPTTVVLSLHIEGKWIIMTFIDDGIGFEYPLPAGVTGHGLNNIIHRTNLLKGLASIKTAPNQGCSITIKIPFTNE